MTDNQKTLKKEYTFEGKGLHSGLKVKMTVAPAPVGTGIRFVREDLGPDAEIEALADYSAFRRWSICCPLLPALALTMLW